MKLYPREWIVGPILSAFIVYLVSSRSLRQETAVELAAWFISVTLVYYLGYALRNAMGRRKSD